MKKRLVALLVLVLVMMLALVSCGDPIGDWLNQFNPKPEEFAVDFSIEGAQVPSQNVKNGDLVTKPEDPTRDGFEFAGWYKDAECTNPWNFDSDKVTQNTVLYGKWNQHVHSGGTATCTTGKICEVCGEEYGAPLGHTEETIPGEAPTCKETGLTEGKKCSVCDETLVAQEEIPATGKHTWGDWIVDKAATDTEDGTNHRDCSVCGEREEGVIPSLTHHHSYDEGKLTTTPGCETKGEMTFTCKCSHSYTEEIPATGHAWNAGEVTAPGCETKGEKTFTCQNDASHTYKEEIPATGHAWDAGEVTTAPTCVATGVKTFTCQNDASHTKKEDVAIDPDAHTLVDVEGKAATCEEEGYTAYKKCSNQGCEHTVGKETLPALGHKWNEGEVTVPATYGHKGTKTFTCQNDETHTKTEDIAQLTLAGNATAEEIVNAAYTLEQGEALIGEFTLTGVITKVDFPYNSYNNNISVTIKIAGTDESKTIYCFMLVGDDIDKIVAGDTVTITGPIKNYNGKVEFDKGCELVSYTEHAHQWSEATCKVLATCSICKKTTGEFADHTYGTDNKCTVCGHDKNSKESWVLVTDVAQLKDGSEIVIVATNANYAIGTNQKSNNRAGASVAKSNNTVTINDGVQVITVGIDDNGNYTFYVEGTTKGYLYAAGGTGSNYLKTTSNVSNTATWTITIADGIATIKCVDSATTRNQIRYNPNTGNGDPLFSCYASGQQDVSIYVKTITEVHTCTPADAVKENEVAPTCTAAGSYDEVVYCSECEKEISRRTVTVDALDHDMKTDAAVAPTCESTGLTEGSHCSRCDYKVAQEVVPALGHKWNDGEVTTKPTCTAAGEKTFTCQNDATHTKTEDVAATGHTEVVDTKVDATCTTTGLTEGKHCSVCNTVLVAQEVIPAGHSDENNDNRCDDCNESLCETHIDNEGVVTTPATCTTAGVKTYTCTACGANYTKEIAALGHRLENVPKVNPTCTQPGHTAYQECSREGCDYETMSAVIAPTNHNYSEEVTTPATCVNEGVKTFTCSKCGDSYTEKIAINPDNHSLADVEGKDATCTVDGYTVYKECTREGCDHITGKETIPATGHKDKNSDYLCDNGCKTLMEPVADSTLTLEEANKLAAAIDSISDSTKYTTNKYYIVGTVKNIANPTYGNPTIVDEDGNEFYSYGMYDTDGETKYEKLEYKPVKGDVVTLYGTIGIYVKNGVASNQMNNGILTNVVPHNHDWSHEATCDAPATCNICGKQNTVAHTPSENELTCSTPIICTVCKNELEKVEHVDENKNGKCDVCKADVPISAGDRKIVFEFGANGEAKHVDGDDLGKSKSYENGEYTLALTEMSKVFGPAYDLKGNSCIKLGTSKVTGTFKFTVPDDVTSVIIYVAGYKGATSTNIKINGTQHTVKTTSDKGEYTAIEIDTTTTKTITLVTVTYRAMIDSIVFVVPGEIKSHEHNVATKEENRVESTCAAAGHYDLVTYCADEDCGEEIRRTEVKLDTADHSYNPVVTKPTCTEDGYTTYTCSVCGHSYEDDPVDALGHNEVAHDAKAATCTEAGHKAYVTCARCNYTTYEEVAKLGHDLVDVAEKKATCTEAGYSAHKDCSRCDYIEGKEDYAVLNHSWKNATCEAPKTCGACGATEGEKLGHTEVTDAAVAATCTTTGLTEGKHCSVCGAITQKQEVVSVIPHTTTKHEGKAATCTETGYEAYETCSKCNYTTYKEIAKLGHTEVTDAAVAATCTTTGLTEGKHCSVCGAITQKQEVVPVIPHTTTQHEGKAATCTETGYEAYETCSKCNYTTYKEIAKLGHNEVAHNAKDPTCTEVGNKAYVTCSRCDYTTYEEIPAQGHSANETNHCSVCGVSLCTSHKLEVVPGKAATCITTGLTDGERCSVCGDITKTQDVIEIDSAAHKWNEGTVTTNPTCTTAGEKTFTCQHNSAHTKTEEVAKLGHDLVDVAEKKATCTEAGYSAHKDCSRCDYIEGKEDYAVLDHSWKNATCEAPKTCGTCGATDGEANGHNWADATCTAPKTCGTCGATEGEANGHDWADATCETLKTCKTCGATDGEALGHTEEVVPGKAATCTKPGLTEGVKCSKCGHVKVAQEVIPALGHTEETIPAVDPTCTETGLTKGTKCSVCEAVIKAQEVIPSLGHAWNDATCEAPKTCGTCGATEGEANGHDWADATCETPKTCETCGATEGEANGHDWADATCTASKTCKTCGVIDGEALGHNKVIDAAIAPTCTETGLTEGSHCSACEAVLVAQEEIPAINHKDKVHHDAVSATCTLTGTVEHWECPNCKKNFADETCTVEIENITIEINSAKHVNTTDHDEDPATCTVNGYTAGTQCDDCGTWISGHEEIPAGHKDEDNDHYCDVCEEKASKCIDTNLDDNLDKCDICGKHMPVEKTFTLTFDANKANRVSFSKTSQVWSANGITFTNNKSASNNAVADYTNPVRLYQNSEVIIEATGMTKIVFKCTDSKNLTLSTTSEYTVSGSGTTTVTVTFNAPVDSFTISKLSAQVRLSSIDVTTLTEAPTLERITVDGINTTYSIGDELNLAGAVVTAVYDDGSTKVVNDYNVDDSAVNKDAAGTYLIKFTYNDGFTEVNAEVEVSYILAYAVGIEVSGMKTSYYVGATLDTTATVTATYNDNTTVEVNGYTVNTDNVAMDTAGTYEVIFTFDDVSVVVEITVNALPADGSTISILQALEIGAIQAHNTYTTEKYCITGTITEIYQTTYGNMYVADEDGNKLQIYGSYSSDGKTAYSSMTHPHKAGQKVTVYGAVGQYDGTAQIKNGWVTIIHEHNYADATCTVPETCTICGTTNGVALGHLDDDKDHACNRTGCTATVGDHIDADGDTVCDYGCSEAISGDAPVLQEKTYSYTFSAKQWSANGDKTLSGVKWTLAGGGGYWGYDGTKGQQFGSGSKPYKTMTLTSDSFSNVNQIVINTSGASSISGSVKIYVGSTLVKTITLTKTATNYTIDVSDLTGEIKFEYTQTSSKAIYIKSISVTYAE